MQQTENPTMVSYDDVTLSISDVAMQIPQFH
jgi:hypothetical protein